MKKIGTLLLSISLFALTVGCGGDTTSPSSPTTPEAAPTSPDNGDDAADPEAADEGDASN